ncbi:reverse transcriptase [Phytophthora megakarya]|uniref:Reverse transcriptase n=1 Tax=Phytophthora megakarya TaxID=4795 RepID=A0A225WY46_9STRA|nr:reverse transcriptase [Phytophthora megakarya]
MAKNAFTMLKAKIIATPVLKHFDLERTPVIVLYANNRTLKANELNYRVLDKKILTLLQILNICYSQLVTGSVKVLSRFSTLAWLLKSKGFGGRLGRVNTKSLGQSQLASPQSRCRRNPSRDSTQETDTKTDHHTPTDDRTLLVVRLDGSALVKRSGGVYSAVVWKLLEWTVVEAMTEYMPE